MDRPNLSVVIPAYNAASFAPDTLRRLRSELPEGTEIIVVEDCSSDGTWDALAACRDDDPALVLLRTDVQSGAGVARNLGFAQATGDYVWFFDVDDIPDCSALLSALDLGAGADAIVCAYDCQRENDAMRRPMANYDIKFWQAVADAGLARTRVKPKDLPEIFQLTNYPWTKLIKRERYVQKGLTFSATRVANDIFAHWFILAEADDVFLFPDSVCTHVYYSSVTQITGISDLRRLQVIDALCETRAYLMAHHAENSDLMLLFLDLSIRIARWSEEKIDNAHRQTFRSRFYEMLSDVPLADILRLLSIDPRNARYALALLGAAPTHSSRKA